MPRGEAAAAALGTTLRQQLGDSRQAASRRLPLVLVVLLVVARPALGRSLASAPLHPITAFTRPPPLNYCHGASCRTGTRTCLAASKTTIAAAPASAAAAARGAAMVGSSRAAPSATGSSSASSSSASAAPIDMISTSNGGAAAVGAVQRRPRVLVDARQVPPEELAVRFPGTDFDVPVELGQALAVFFGHPSIVLITAGLSALAWARAALGGALTWADAVAVPVVVVGWVVQEWFIHKHLLHGLPGWLGHDIHEQHHELPFFHVSIDPPPVVLAWGAAACSLAWMAIPGPGLSLTVMLVYWAMGLLYEWSHYIVHTKVRPATAIGKAIKQHHTRHHLHDERYWFAFTWPGIDDVMGTVPPPKTQRQPMRHGEEQKKQ